MLKIQEEFEVVGVQGGTHDHAAETVGGRFVVAEQIQEADAKHGEVLGGVARTGPAGVFAENVERKVKNRTTAKTSYVIHFSTKEDFSKNAQNRP